MAVIETPCPKCAEECEKKHCDSTTCTWKVCLACKIVFNPQMPHRTMGYVVGR